MDYEFHVGDYVETVEYAYGGSSIGYICKVRRSVADWWIKVKLTDGAFVNYFIPEELSHFKRIGKYDFAKKKEGKIEPVSNDPADWEDSFVLNKINELVDAVNELKEKIK